MAQKKSLDEMRDEAYRRQDNLASDIDELIDRVHPKNAVTRWKNELVGSVRSFSAAGDGKTPVTLPVAIAGGVIGVVLIGAGIAAIALSGGEGKAVRKVEAERAKAERMRAETQKVEAKARKKARALRD